MSEKPEDIQCPVCGYYCLGKGGHGCIDKPSLCGMSEAVIPATVDSFEGWLRTACFQSPTVQAYDLAKEAWKESKRHPHPSVIAAVRALEEALEHQIANPGSRSEYYRCYTYRLGELPEWVHKSRNALSDPYIRDMLKEDSCCDLCQINGHGSCKSDDYDNEPVVEESEEE
ncbi:hypothetical protein KAR91_09280 [Candidatus Pacearchaeota archaeon]|nr:hypothetical protein [Candidatus Pacearchaeota archaeon]